MLILSVRRSVLFSAALAAIAGLMFFQAQAMAVDQVERERPVAIAPSIELPLPPVAEESTAGAEMGPGIAEPLLVGTANP